ncbi:MAG TPA: TIM barrel protein [Bryobacteraceae bacterium]|nr:TIM barrel protein [Bryobacteraceae bacterium]
MRPNVKIGTTSYGFRYLLHDERRAPSLVSIVESARGYGLDCLQVCENARPLDLSPRQWDDVLHSARNIGLEVRMGCMTLDLGTLDRYLERTAMIPDSSLRIVLEETGRGRPARAELERFLDAAAPRLQAAGIALAVENHFDIPCRVLAEVAAPYPPSLIGFCLDSANSLRNFESPNQVFDYLGSRAMFYHLKDYKVSGTNVGFTVTGATLGSGDLDLDGFLEKVFVRTPEPLILLENWVPATGDWDTDVEEDSRWLRLAVESLSRMLERQ